jgi:hypothetical protein
MFGLNAQKVEWATNTAERRKGVPKAIRELERQLEEMRHGMEWYPADEEAEEGAEAKKAVREEDEGTGQFNVSLERRPMLTAGSSLSLRRPSSEKIASAGNIPISAVQFAYTARGMYQYFQASDPSLARQTPSAEI